MEKCFECNNSKGKFDKFDLCPSCIARHFQDETWTSRNQDIDTFIKYTQLSANDPERAVVWANWEEFTNVEKIGKGGFSTVYSARWLKEDEESENSTVALKTVGDQNGLSTDFLNEAAALFHCYNQETSCFRILGFTYNPNSMQYYIITSYADNGDLRRYMRRNLPTMTWRDILFIIWDISMDLEWIHKAGLVHRDIHPGNILHTGIIGHVFDRGIHNGVAYISDFGLSMAAACAHNTSEIYGVMPYIAPEVFRGCDHSTASDVYSIGIVMWELTSGERAFKSIPHDINLALNICDGLRPKPVPGTIPFYLQLMQSCWHQDPSQRPTAKEIRKKVEDWCFKPDQEKERQMAEAEKTAYVFDDDNINSEAIYTSRSLSTVTTVGESSEQHIII